jgi:large subunit ribosomal protein L10
MPRPDKVETVEEIKENFQRSGAVILTEYRGLKVKDLQNLRRQLAGAGADYHVFKNTLVGFAVRDLDFGDLESYLTGPTAIAFCGSDPVAPAKVLSDFARTNPALVLKASLLQGRVLDPERTRALADLESREVLLAKAAGVMQAPMSQTLGVLQALVRKAVGLVDAYRQKRVDAGESPPAPTAADADAAAVAEMTAAEPAPERTPEPAADADPAPEATAEPAAEADPAPEANAEPAAEAADVSTSSPDVDDGGAGPMSVPADNPDPESSGVTTETTEEPAEGSPVPEEG